MLSAQNPYTGHIAIIGYGYVGRCMSTLFRNPLVYDPNLAEDQPGVRLCNDQAYINEHAKLAYICVPTPMDDNGACDTSIVEATIRWLEADVIVICSTVPPGFTQRMSEETGKNCIHEPEFFGESKHHPWKTGMSKEWVILGGKKELTSMVAGVYQSVFSANVPIIQTDSLSAELAKYMENSWLATKVSFCNEWFDICKSFGADYNVVKELWLMDPRVTRSHTSVDPYDRGYGGKCLPKDVNAIVKAAADNGTLVPLLTAALQYVSRQHQEKIENNAKPVKHSP